MAEREIVNGWLERVAAEIGGPELRLDAAGVCAFRYEDACDVAIETPEGSEQVYFYAVVLDGTKADGAALHRHLLVLNAYMLGSRGGALGLDPQNDQVVLSRAEPLAALGPKTFERMLGNFVDAARALSDELAAFDPGQDDEARPRPGDPRLTMIRA